MKLYILNAPKIGSADACHSTLLLQWRGGTQHSLNLCAFISKTLGLVHILTLEITGFLWRLWILAVTLAQMLYTSNLRESQKFRTDVQCWSSPQFTVDIYRIWGYFYFLTGPVQTKRRLITFRWRAMTRFHLLIMKSAAFLLIMAHLSCHCHWKNNSIYGGLKSNWGKSWIPDVNPCLVRL